MKAGYLTLSFMDELSVTSRNQRVMNILKQIPQKCFTYQVSVRDLIYPSLVLAVAINDNKQKIKN